MKTRGVAEWIRRRAATAPLFPRPREGGEEEEEVEGGSLPFPPLLPPTPPTTEGSAPPVPTASVCAPRTSPEATSEVLAKTRRETPTICRRATGVKNGGGWFPPPAAPGSEEAEAEKLPSPSSSAAASFSSASATAPSHASPPLAAESSTLAALSGTTSWKVTATISGNFSSFSLPLPLPVSQGRRSIPEAGSLPLTL